MEIVYQGKEAYRAMYSTKIGEKIYVLHCCHKKSPRGKETPKPDIVTLDARIKKAKELAKLAEEKSDGKRK